MRPIFSREIWKQENRKNYSGAIFRIPNELPPGPLQPANLMVIY